MTHNNETDPNVKQWENEQHERNMLVSPSYREWWEQNKERILEEDKLNHDMQFKAAYAKHGDY
jgi:hypothetical protein